SFLNRGVTALQGKGMYTGQAHSVLLCAVAPAEIAHLKALVYRVDEHAFVVVNPTEEVWGAGFSNLEPRWKRPMRKTKSPPKETGPKSGSAGEVRP
ncbi:MAG: YitT family protein, partial [Chloroflexi bacterium]|nr:YitT family protein [Chloroflexota bacterium]